MARQRRYIESVNGLRSISCNMEEQETTVSFYRNEDTMRIFTSDNTTLTYLKKRLEANPNEWKCWEAGRTASGDVVGYFFEAPKKYLSFRTESKERVMTDEQRQAAAERMRELRSKK